jgi:hypothetical protein
MMEKPIYDRKIIDKTGNPISNKILKLISTEMALTVQTT